MPKKGKKKSTKGKDSTLSALPKKQRPKKKCCESRPRCTRCPLRMLADGTLPEGYTVKKSKLVRTAAPADAA